MATRQACLRLAGVLALLGLCAVSRAAVFTVDYGSESIKVAVVSPRLKPDPIAIAINEMSKRKSPALVAISAGDRLVSEEAAGIVARYPERVYSRARDLIGVPYDDAKALLARSYLAYHIIGSSQARTNFSEDGTPAPAQGEAGSAVVARSDDKVWVRTHDGVADYMAEEIVGMLLEYARQLAETHAKFEVVDAVVSVPAFFSQSQRQALLDAALLVQVNIMALVHEHSGVALQYGMFRAKELEEERHVMFYDIGAGSTYAAIVHYSKYTVKERGKNVTNPQFQVKGVRWDHELGGQSLELRLLEHFAVEFNKQMGDSFDVRKLPKSMAKLRKEVKRTKEVLSANTEAPINVESLYEENDFRSSITRGKFEELCADLWPRALAPMKQVLEDTGLGLEDLHAVEIIGGTTRVPKIQAVLQEFLGPNKTLDRHLDADESLALGASWLAANLSDGFKLNRRVGMVDGLPFAVLYQVKAAPEAAPDSVEAASEPLFARLKKFPLKIVRSLKQHPSDDFELSFLYDESEGLPPRWPAGTPLAMYRVVGSKNATEKYSSYNLTSPLRTTLHFGLSRSGVVSLDKAEVVVEFSEWTEVRVPLIPPHATTASNSTNTTTTANSTEGAGSEEGAEVEEKGADGGEKAGEGEEGGNQAKAAAGTAQGGEGKNETEAVEEPKYEIKMKLRKRTIRMPLEVEDITKGFQSLMTEDEAVEAEKRISALRRRDEEKKATAEAKNALEAYIYATKDKLESEEEALGAVSSEEQREGIRSQLLDAEEWLYMDGENAGPSEFKAKLKELRKEADAMLFRQKELTDRPAAVESAKAFLETSRELLSSWKDEKPWINQTRIDPLYGELVELENWLQDKEVEQGKLKPHEEPAFSSKTVINRMSSIQERISRVERTPKPKPKKTSSPPPEAKTNSSSQANETEPEIRSEAADEGDSGLEKAGIHDEL